MANLSVRITDIYARSDGWIFEITVESPQMRMPARDFERVVALAGGAEERKFSRTFKFSYFHFHNILFRTARCVFCGNSSR